MQILNEKGWGMRTILIGVVIFLFFLLSYFVPIEVVHSDSVKDCLKCHSSKALTKELLSKETLSLYVDGSKFEKSVHGALECSACHTDITMKTHPRPKKIESRKAYVREISKNCLLCHPKDALMKPKMHGELVKKEEVSCGECHGSHYIEEMKGWKKKASFSQYCLYCHKHEVSKTLPSKETLSLKVNEEEIKKSVHGKFECIVCHSDFSKISHPLYNLKSKSEYRARMTEICVKCHTDKDLQKNPSHYALSKTASCIECHGAHGVQSVKAVKALPLNKYCLSCHGRAISMRMKNGEILSVQVKESDILGSAHKNLKCNECHKEFSTTQHPVRTYESISDFRDKAKDICNYCHKQEVTKYDQSIHAMALKKGNAKAPDCLKCHDYHKTPWIKADKLAGVQLCAKCHAKETDAFRTSIHNTALTQGKKDAPACSYCHNAHDVLPTNIAKINDSCVKCHKNIKDSHNKWLWNPPLRLTTFVDTHFNSASCSACHISGDKVLALTLIDKKKKKALTEEDVAKAFDVDVKEIRGKIDFNGDGRVQEGELWRFMSTLKKKVDVDLAGRVDIAQPNDAHRITAKAQAVKDCEACHNPKAEFSGRLEINREGAKPVKFDLDRKAFNSVYSIPNVSDFYILGSTKINIFDILFLLALAAGLAVALGHITLRILTAPIRRRRREGK